MKKNNIWSLSALIIALALASCAKEPTPTPSTAKNWLQLTEPTADADDVDKKIWDIYQEFGVPIFYTDTLGSVDYGVVDEDGNHVLSYQMLHPADDMTDTGNTMTAITPVKHWIAADKAKMMRMLTFLESDLLPKARKAQLELPVIYVAQTATMMGSPMKVLRRGNVCTVSLDAYWLPMFDVMPAQIPYAHPPIVKNYRVEFIVKNMGRTLDAKLEPFFKVTADLMRNYSDYPWTRTGNVDISFSNLVVFPQLGVGWRDLQINEWITRNYAGQIATLKGWVSYYTERNDYASAAFSADAVNRWENVNTQADMWKQRFNRYHPCAFGYTPMYTRYHAFNATVYIHLNGAANSPVNLNIAAGFQYATDFYTLPSRQNDFGGYLYYLVTQTPAMINYYIGAWPACLERMEILKGILADMDLSVEELTAYTPVA